MFAQIVVRFPGIFRRIDLMAQLLQLNFEVVTQQGIILKPRVRAWLFSLAFSIVV
ncbi:Uncharacterised protein [Klebsiella pneumoniae]|uniref:Uncharacterized protein n=1 Tax=Klebsiella pneumoniae TaxID=573 RepID=A0A377XQM9_KLEPN|nr:Uncharacterised protein [Klebsiella pneumoniae]